MIQCWNRRLRRSCSARRGYSRVSSWLCFTGPSTLEGVRIYMPFAHSHDPWRQRITIHSICIQPTQTSGLHRTTPIHQDLMLVPTLLQLLRARSTRRPSIGCETIRIHAIRLPRIANRLSRTLGRGSQGQIGLQAAMDLNRLSCHLPFLILII